MQVSTTFDDLAPSNADTGARSSSNPTKTGSKHCPNPLMPVNIEARAVWRLYHVLLEGFP